MEWFSLGYLHEQRDGVPLSAMAIDMQTSLPYLTNIIYTMVDKGLVERVGHAKDNRMKLIQLLPAANELYVTVEQNLQSRFNEFALKKIPPSDLAAYLRVVRRLAL